MRTIASHPSPRIIARLQSGRLQRLIIRQRGYFRLGPLRICPMHGLGIVPLILHLKPLRIQDALRLELVAGLSLVLSLVC